MIKPRVEGVAINYANEQLHPPAKYLALDIQDVLAKRFKRCAVESELSHARQVRAARTCGASVCARSGSR